MLLLSLYIIQPLFVWWSDSSYEVFLRKVRNVSKHLLITLFHCLIASGRESVWYYYAINVEYARDRLWARHWAWSWSFENVINVSYDHQKWLPLPAFWSETKPVHGRRLSEPLFRRRFGFSVCFCVKCIVCTVAEVIQRSLCIISNVWPVHHLFHGSVNAAFCLRPILWQELRCV